MPTFDLSAARTDLAPGPDTRSAAIRDRVRRDSRLITRLQATEPADLHDECQRLGLPHEGRTPAELRAVLFTRLRRA